MLQKRKIPRWEIESYEPGDRNYDFSSYAVDKATEKRIEKKHRYIEIVVSQQTLQNNFKIDKQYVGRRPKGEKEYEA